MTLSATIPTRADFIGLLDKMDCGASGIFESAVAVLNEPRFWTAPASLVKHQAFEGGLAAHTYEVMGVALDMLRSRRDGSDPHRHDLLALAALWHDYGKIASYEAIEPPPRKGARYRRTPYGEMLGHIPLSHAMFCQVAETCCVEPADRAAVEHMILSHHGRLEWGSPVEPQTAEAWALHAADMLSARFSAPAVAAQEVPA